ncbi:ATP-binding cassette domain-containing protein [[Eubacterium] cellulosolvens]
MIEVDHISKIFNGIKAVNDVSFKVNQGEIFGFLGPNGAGKTTTINILCTLIRPTYGSARINGYDILREPDRVRRSIGLIFQDPSLDDKLTAEENLIFHAILYGVKGLQQKRQIDEVLRMVELADRKKDLVKTFSGGMKRRLEIARGLLHRPKVLFLDEPTLGLDPQTRSHVWDYINNLRRMYEMTIFLTTHYMDEAENCDRIAIIDHGTIIALDTPEGLKRHVGGDVLTVRTSNDVEAEKEIGERYKLKVRRDQHGLTLEVENGEEFIPQFVSKLKTNIISLHLRRPTLNDVFLKLTGREIRDGEGSATDRIRAIMRARNR